MDNSGTMANGSRFKRKGAGRIFREPDGNNSLRSRNSISNGCGSNSARVTNGSNPRVAGRIGSRRTIGKPRTSSLRSKESTSKK